MCFRISQNTDLSGPFPNSVLYPSCAQDIEDGPKPELRSFFLFCLLPSLDYQPMRINKDTHIDELFSRST